MSELGNLLELLHDAHRSVSTFQARYRDWSQPRSSLELTVDLSESGHRRLQWEGGGPFPAAMASTRQIWFERPDCLRVEIHQQNELMRFGVLTRTQWWRWDRSHGADTSEAPAERHGGWQVPPLLSPPQLDPLRLLSGLRFDPTGRSIRAGREVLCARASPRESTASGRNLTYELEFDALHGTLLRWAALVGGHLVDETKVVEITYDAPIEAEAFAFVAPDGRPIRCFAPVFASPDGRGVEVGV
jgi:hypothetical protein